MLVMFFTIGIGNAWGAALKVSDLDFGTPDVSMDFNSVTGVPKSTGGTSSSTKSGTSLSGYGGITHYYFGKSTSCKVSIKAAATPMTSQYVELGATTKGAIAGFTRTFATKGAFSFNIAKSSVTYIGLYNAHANTSDFYAKAKSSVYLYFTGSKIQINNGSGWVDAVADMTSLPDVFEVVVVYNNTASSATYNGGNTTLGAKTAHIFVNGTAVMNAGGTAPKDFAIPGASLTGWRICYNGGSATAKVDDIKIYDNLPAAAASCTSEITITKGSNPANGTFTISNSGTVCIDGGNASTTVTATPNSHYHLASVTSTGGGSVGAISNNTCTVSNISANTTINVTFAADPTYTVTWVAGSNPSFSTQTNYAGTALSDPGEPSAASYCPGGKEFVGWTATPIVGEGNEPADLFTSVSGKSIPVDGITYYAVFATRGGSGSVTKSDELTYTSFFAACSSSGSNTSGSYTNFSGKSGSESDAVYDGNLFKHGNGPSNCKDYIQMRTSSNSGIIATTSGGKAKKVTVEWNSGTANAKVVNIYGKNTAYSAISDLFSDATDGDLLGTITKGTSTELTITEDYEYIGIRSSDGAIYFDAISIDWQASGGYTYSNYATTCCTPLGTINGSVSWSNAATAVVSWDNLAHVSSWTVKYKTHAAGEWSTAGASSASAGIRSVTISSLTPCTNYDFKIIATPDDGYCDKDQTIEDSQTHNWTVTSTITNGTKTSVPTTACGDYTATFAASSGFHFPAKGDITVTGASDFGWNSSTGVLTISGANITGDITISITCPADACSDQFSLHTGNKDQGGWVTNQCFVDADWGAVDDAIYVGAFPLTNECYVGWEGGGSYYGANWAVGGIKTYDIPTGRTLGWDGSNYYHDYPGGALGTFHIHKNSTEVNGNYYLRFKPSSYILRTGSDGTSWTSREMTVSATNSHYYETAELDLTSTLISEHAYVDLKTSGGDGHVWCNFSNDRTASGNVKVKSSVGDADGNFRGDNLKASDNGTHGKFRIDVTKDVDNWKLAFVPMYRITYAAGTGASGSMDPSSYAEISTTIAAAANGFTAPTGKQFNGWSDGVNSYAAGANVTMNSNVTLTAQWTDIDYTVTVSQSPDVSATTTGQTTTAHYNTTINLTTTVPSGYRFVNWTTSDGFSITNPTSATTASFTMPAKNVTVTANFQQTHTVDWYVGGTAPANKLGDDGQTTVVDHGGKITNFPATTPDGTPCDKTFVGWTNTSSYVHGTSPLFNDVAGSPTINADASFYAVFAEVNSVSASLTKMTADDDLEVGDKIVIIAQDTRYGMYQASASSYVSYWTTTDMDGEPSLSEIEADDKKYLDVAAGSASNTWKLGDATNGYLYNASSTNLEFSTTNSSDLTLIAWTDHSFTFVAGQEVSCRTDITGANANKWRGAGASCDPEEYTNCSGTPYYYLYKYVPSSTTATGHTIICAACANTVTVSYNAAPTGATVAVMKGGTPVTENGTVKTCTGSIELTVTITPAAHYTLNSLSAQISSTDMSQSHVGNVYTVTIPQNQTGTLVLTPSLTEDAHKVISWVVHGGSASIADGHGTTWVYSGEDLTAIPTAPDAPTGCDDKVFVGWSENDGGATEEDASYYDDLFTTLGGAPTGITIDKTFTAVFATPAAGLGGTVMWDEPFDGDAGDQPSSPTSGATVYGSASIAYNCASTTYCKLYTDNLASGGAAAPELLVPKSSRSEAFEVTGIPTAGQTELTLTYMAKDALSVTTGTSGVTVGDASADGKLYTRTITIDQSGLGVASFGLTFAKSTDSNSRLDDIHLVVPGSSSMSGYVTTCEDTWTVTYYKNTEDAVTNLPSPTGISKSTGSGTLSSKVPVRYGYTFDGWATSAGGSVVYAAGAAVSSVSADMDLYAKWSVTPVTEINLSKTSLDKYVGDPSVTLSVLSVLPDGANTSVTWSSSNSSIATVNSSTGEVNFVAEGTADIIATSTVTNATTATCVVTVWAKPTVSFLDNLHSLTEDKDGNALSGYNLTDVAGTPVVFPILANQSAGSGTCEDEHYVFVGWTTSDNNTDPEDHLVTSHNLTNGDNITYYAVWADGVAGTTYTKLTNSTFKTSPAKYVIGAAHADSGTEHYLYSCEKTDKNNSWGYVTADLASNTPIEFTLSGTAAALVATSTEVSARYLKPLADKDFQMSASSQTVELKSDGTIYNNNTGDTSWRLLYNKAGGLRWYSSNVSGSTNAYFYEVVAGGEVNYRTSCCADKVAAPTVTATKTSTTVTLTWAAVSGATGYELQWNGGAWTAATSGVVKSDLTPNTNYSWRVRATYVPPKCGADIASGSTTTNQVYHVTYAKGSGTGSCNATGSTTDGTAYEAGATVTLQSNGFTLVGHTFNEWTEDDEDITISSNQFTMPEHDVVITATWTPKVDKFYDRMHDGTDASHGGIADGDGKYYITREGCSYTVPSLTDNTSGATACHTKHYVLMGWTAESHLNSDGTLKTGHEGYVYTGGGTQTATGATYYAVWAEVEE